jgi:hypothetical protein
MGRTRSAQSRALVGGFVLLPNIGLQRSRDRWLASSPPLVSG